jgi:hypothetical protein
MVNAMNAMTVITCRTLACRCFRMEVTQAGCLGFVSQTAASKQVKSYIWTGLYAMGKGLRLIPVAGFSNIGNDLFFLWPRRVGQRKQPCLLVKSRSIKSCRLARMMVTNDG